MRRWRGQEQTDGDAPEAQGFQYPHRGFLFCSPHPVAPIRDPVVCSSFVPRPIDLCLSRPTPLKSRCRHEMRELQASARGNKDHASDVACSRVAVGPRPSNAWSDCLAGTLGGRRGLSVWPGRGVVIASGRPSLDPSHTVSAAAPRRQSPVDGRPRHWRLRHHAVPGIALDPAGVYCLQTSNRSFCVALACKCGWL